MMRIIATWFLNAFVLYLVTRFVSGVTVTGYGGALIAVFVIGLINTLIKPILLLLTLPITFLTLGLFIFILNAFLFLLAGALTPGFSVSGMGSAIVGSLFYSVLSWLFQSLVKSSTHADHI